MLQIHYVKDQVVRELFNPFPTIAVWAAVRFVINKSTIADQSHDAPNNNNVGNDTNYSCAFLPLISDPGEDERKRLFQPMSENMKQILVRKKVIHDSNMSYTKTQILLNIIFYDRSMGVIYFSILYIEWIIPSRNICMHHATQDDNEQYIPPFGR